MIWESTKILTLIDEKKWNKLNTQEQKLLSAQLQIWLSIHYLIRLSLSGHPVKHQYELLIKYYNDHPNIFQHLKLYEVLELYSRVRTMIPYYLYLN